MGRTWQDLADKLWPDRLQDVQDALAQSFGIPTLFVSPAGRPLAACEDLARFCRWFTRAIPISRPCLECGRAAGVEEVATSTIAAMKFRPLVHVCPLGLLDVALPILAAGQVLGHLVTAQVSVQEEPEGVPSLPITVETDECVAFIAGSPRKPRPELEAAGTGLAAVAWTIGTLAAARRRNLRLTERLREHSKLIQEQSVTDPVTGALNRRRFRQLLRGEVARARRYRRSLSVAVLDIQGFRRINEEFGHEVGDSVLRAAAQCLAANVRETDAVARVGGDEFALLFPETARHEAMIALARVEGCIENLNASGELPVEVHVSVGVVDDIERGDDMMQAAFDTARKAYAAQRLVA